MQKFDPSIVTQPTPGDDDFNKLESTLLQDAST